MTSGPCDYLQREVDALEEEIQANLEELRPPLPPFERRRLIQLPKELRKATAALRSCSLPLYPHLVQAEGIEVTQAVQTFIHSVELISSSPRTPSRPARRPAAAARPTRFPERATAARDEAGGDHISVVARVNLTRKEGSVPRPDGPRRRLAPRHPDARAIGFSRSVVDTGTIELGGR